MTPDAVRPAVGLAILRGLARRCPSCGVGHSFQGYLKVTDCPHCGEALGHIRADDFPPYLTIAIVGHMVVPLLLMTERYLAPPTWMLLSFAVPVTLGLTLTLLPRVKGGILGLMWHLGLKGDETQ
ncbi:MAG: hypothetical protein COW30_09520 [Rhodospirillales bacterium CG15_BIG_FIL_POST_REV_8_21_14_020_66_15]|nr:MAG: hypothetical protein COW30_09520 [Rhodospirillales bacterium CG15_BIG_FIL_POST_REV_8_21_14_020_66_15]